MKTRFVSALLAAALYLPTYAAGQVVQGQATFQTFPVSGNPAGLYNLDVGQISNTGYISGYFTLDPNPYSVEAFLRSPNGKITDLNDPQGDSPTFGPYTTGLGVNAWGTVVGYIWDTHTTPNHFSGFFYSNGKFDNYDVPGLPRGSDTLIYGINDFGAFCGYYGAAPDYTAVPFVDFAEQIVTNFDIPGSTFTYPLSVNNLGQVAGSWYDSGNVEHGFVRNPDGKIIEIDVPGASSTANYGTQVQAVNDFGWVSGHYWKGANNYEHGFVRSPQGVFYQIDVPGAATTLADGGTSGGALNDQGILVGHYDPQNLREPERGYIATLKFYKP